jgi:hypothetical protein
MLRFQTRARALSLLVACGLLTASSVAAQERRDNERQAQLRARFAASGLTPGKPFPAIDIHDAAGKPFNTASLKGFHTVVVSGCNT